MKYAHIIDNNLMGWHDTNIHKKIPTPKIEVTDEVWQEALNINANCYENGEFIVKNFRTDEEILKQELEIKINEAKAYLLSTDYKMTIDYFATLTKEIQDELILKRAESRDFIRDNS